MCDWCESWPPLEPRPARDDIVRSSVQAEAPGEALDVIAAFTDANSAPSRSPSS
jgi:hypothetical protein